jgi:glycogen debranching enzyme
VQILPTCSRCAVSPARIAQRFTYARRAWGLAQIGDSAGALRLASAMFDAAAAMHSSLPELYCGFSREPRLGPVPYPVACHPQAGAASSVFVVLQAMLGLSIDGISQTVVFRRPVLLKSVDWLKLEELRVGEGTISLCLRPRGHGPRAEIEILDKSPDVKLIVRE